MKAALIGTLCGLFISAVICCGGYLAYQRVETNNQLNFQRYIYMRAKSTRLQFNLDMIRKDNDNLLIDIQLLKRQNPQPTLAPKKVNPC